MSNISIPLVNCGYAGKVCGNQTQTNSSNSILPDNRTVDSEKFDKDASMYGNYSKSLCAIKEKMQQLQDSKDSIKLYRECIRKCEDLQAEYSYNDDSKIDIIRTVGKDGKVTYTKCENGKPVESAIIGKNCNFYRSSNGKSLAVTKGTDEKGNDVIVVIKQDDSGKEKGVSYLITLGKDGKNNIAKRVA